MVARVARLLKREGYRLRRTYQKAVAEGCFTGTLHEWVELDRADRAKIVTEAHARTLFRSLFVPRV